jgi:hypothetical protein
MYNGSGKKSLMQEFFKRKNHFSETTKLLDHLACVGIVWPPIAGVVELVDTGDLKSPEP